LLKDSTCDHISSANNLLD